MAENRLDPLLDPGSIALLGASTREGSPGAVLAGMVLQSGYAGRAYPVNPGYQEIHGHTCYPDLVSLPEAVDHVVIALGNERVEKALVDTIRHGARAATIYASTQVEGDAGLGKRLAAMAREAGLAVCGVNCMGFYNVTRDLGVGIYTRPRPVTRGRIAHIAQSGAAFTTLTHNGCRLGFNLAVSTGTEMTVTTADYMDWALAQESTRVISLFLETVRDPAAFIAALETAAARDIPVVVLKVGRTDLAREMALTHTGAITGDHAAFDALCRRHGVIQVRDFDQMAAVLMLLQTGRAAAPGGLAAAFESGGFRELFADLARDAGVPFAEIGAETRESLASFLEPGLVAENPLDAWGTADRYEERLLGCMRALMADPAVGAGVFPHNFRDNYFLSEGIFRVMETVGAETGKPLAMVNLYGDLANDDLSRRGFEAGIPLIDGASEALEAIGHLFARRDRISGSKVAAGNDAPLATDEIKALLDGIPGDAIGENDALDVLSRFGVPVVKLRVVENAADLGDAADALGFPLVLKTAMPDIHHKSDVGGVVIGIRDRASLGVAYNDMQSRLGPRVLLSAMAPAGVEIALGASVDPQFGPVVMVAAGGVLVEMLADRAVALCPVDAIEAGEMLDSLRIAPLLHGVRGKPGVDLPALVETIVTLSRFAVAAREMIEAVDLNPVIASPGGVVAVDALMVRRRTPTTTP